MKPEQIIFRMSELVNTLVRWLTAILTASFTLIVFISVLSRYVFDFSILASVELSKLLFVWSCFLAATIAYKKQVHIRFEFASTLLGKTGVKITDVAIHIFTLLFFIAIFVKSLSFIKSIWRTYFPIMGISQGWLYVAVAASSIIFILHNLVLLAKSVHQFSR
jgi:TRAP-type C4-dicarboxylate transport system permease small subunit